MRICQIMLASGFGGAERHFVDLSRLLAERGHEVLAICRRGATSFNRLRHVHRLELADMRVLGSWDPLAVRHVRDHLRRFAPAVVQAHLARAACIAGKAMGPADAPLLAKTHNYVKLKYYRGVDMFIPTTRDQAAYLSGAGVAADRMERIPNFHAGPVVSAVPAPEQPERVVALGRMVRKKGFHVLLEALGRLLNAGCPFYLRLGGDGPERAGLERLARASHLEERARLTGWVEDVPGFVRGAALFVLPSLDEPFGIVLLEAMASGVPIVATSTRGPSEILDEDCAFLVAPGDAQALAEAIACALDNPEERRRRAERALARLQQEFSADVVVPRIEALYQRVASTGLGE